ncbi:sulfurtransferase-like selenium metabolism protein YedF [Marinifilum caeruleilacunae]|jgi:selenium metabolism protein YedF|uniref:Sulfurtransferase-like selenium metabolism protein YedF n=1 Tax=Marinifilum caeruleilacunae TaxID=2499076 RepID=A0ABX1WYP9_9BACT|nr:sulfurtransferase-like selenium metabolism protein YedF [Marinifilum caeruleilacunae]NOU61116.1 sulfurtransferase-like selenium metabolism protein YedF [Marinifilum caeruleilacunae]
MHKNTLIQVNQYGMGAGSEELGVKLATNYFTLLDAEGRLPKIIVFYNAGVKLICEGSPALEALKNLQEKGVRMLACKTCLDYFNLLDKIKVGSVGSMPDIITLQADADKVINL